MPIAHVGSGNSDLLSGNFGKPGGFARKIGSDLFVDYIDLVLEIGSGKTTGEMFGMQIAIVGFYFLEVFVYLYFIDNFGSPTDCYLV